MKGFRTAAVALSGIAWAASAHAQAAPGTVRASPESLAPLFASVCLESAGLPEAQVALRGLGMNDNPATGTFFHPEFNLSINPAGDECSMVFELGADASADLAAFRSALGQSAGADRAASVAVTSFEPSDTVFGRAGADVRW